MRKNVSSQVVCAQMVALADGTDVTSGTTAVYVLGDGGSQSAGGGTVTHEGNGTWSYVPTQAETNYAHIAFTFKNALAVSSTVNVYTVGQDFTASALNCTVTTNNDKTGYSLSSPGISDIRDSVWAKTMTELSSVPGVTADVLSSLNWIFTISRNKRTQTATTETIFKDDGSTTLATSTKSDDGLTSTLGEYV